MATTSAIGISQGGVTTIIGDLEKYRATLNSKCNIDLFSLNITRAIKGSYSERAIKNMIKSINNKMHEYYQQLDQLEEQLRGISKEYFNSDYSNNTFANVNDKVLKDAQK